MFFRIQFWQKYFQKVQLSLVTVIHFVKPGKYTIIIPWLNHHQLQIGNDYSRSKLNLLKIKSPDHYTASKVSKYGIFSGPYFPVFSLNTGKCSSEKTSYWDTTLCCSVFLIKLVGLQARCFPVKFAKFLKNIYFKEHLRKTASVVSTPTYALPLT